MFLISQSSGKRILLLQKLQEVWVDANTLTVVCDTHRQEMVAAQEALEISERRIVIDHHRRAADFVENPLLTYLEPTASSTSELVTELVQYAGVPVKTFKSGSHRYLCRYRIRYEELYPTNWCAHL